MAEKEHSSAENGFLQKDFKLTATYSQEPDCEQTGSEPQFLYLSVEDCGGGPYIVMETERWAMDSVDDFIELLKEFKKKYKKLNK